MPYLISSNEPIEKSIQSILRTGFTDALNVLSLSKGLHKEQFKQARKSLKKVRAVLRLVSDSISRAQLEREEETIKAISKNFRDVRDAHVTEEVVSRLLDQFKSEMDVSPYTEIGKKLFELSQETTQKVFSKESKLRDAIKDLQGALERVDQLEFKGNIWDSIQQGLKDSYRDAFDCNDDCQSRSEEDAFIDWRKSVKFLRYNLDFLKEFLSDELKTWNRDLHRLSDCLGEFQDLQMVANQIEENKESFGEKKTVKGFLELVSTRQKHLRKESLNLGETLFHDPPKNFIRWVRETSKRWPKAA